MANPNTPYGLVPVQLNGGAEWRDSLTVYQIPTSATAAVYVGDPVIKLAASADVNGVNGVRLATAGTAALITGVVCGFIGTGTAQLGQPGAASFFGFSGTPGNVYRPANATSVYYVLVNDDPKTLYAVQSNDSGGAPAATVVGKNANLALGAGSPYTGWSGWKLAANQIAATSTYQVNIKGFLPEIDNLPGSTNAKLLVTINQDTEVPPATGI